MVFWPRSVLLTLAFLIPPGMVAVFVFAAGVFGPEVGYLAGFATYWLVCCLLLPRLLLGSEAFTTLLRDRQALFSRANWPAALVWFLVIAVTALMYGSTFTAASPLLMLLAVLLAGINGLCEELLWRGSYTRAFPGNPWLAIVIPSIGFTLWHLAPQAVYPADPVAEFTLSTAFLGLAYGFIAYRTGSAKWTFLSHAFIGTLALADPLPKLLLSMLGG